MTNLTLAKALLEILAVIAICYGFYHEEKFVRFERKAFIFVKCVAKALFYTVKEKFSNKDGKVITLESVPADNEHLNNNKDSDIRIA